MKYIDYKNMKDFYTIAEVCRLFEMEMIELQRYSEKYKIHPQEDQYGNWGFRKQMFSLTAIKIRKRVFTTSKKSLLAGVVATGEFIWTRAST